MILDVMTNEGIELSCSAKVHVNSKEVPMRLISSNCREEDERKEETRGNYARDNIPGGQGASASQDCDDGEKKVRVE